MANRSLITLTIIAVGLFGLSCKWLSGRSYNADKTSPNGTYRVKVAVRVEDERDVAGHFTEQGKIQVLKGQEIIYAYDWNYRDNWEPTFIDCNPTIEWVGDNILRMGGDTSGQPFTDELIISNTTNEHLKHAGVSCGKYEHFDVFDIAPHGQVVLRPSPGLNPDVSGDFSLGYGGETQSGKKFDGALRQRQPDSSVRLQITVNAKDFK